MFPKEKRIHLTDKTLIISDIQLFQKGLLLYEYEKRTQNFGVSKEEISKLIRENSHKELLEKSDKRIIELYLNMIKDKEQLIDLGDFIYQLNRKKFNELKLGLHGNCYNHFFRELKKFKGRKYLVEGNHDLDSEILSQYFSSGITKDYFWDYNEKTNTYSFLTHYPISKKNELFFPELTTFIKQGNEVINFHGHLHSKSFSEGKYKNVKYINRSIDFF